MKSDFSENWAIAVPVFPQRGCCCCGSIWAFLFQLVFVKGGVKLLLTSDSEPLWNVPRYERRRPGVWQSWQPALRRLIQNLVEGFIRLSPEFKHKDVMGIFIAAYWRWWRSRHYRDLHPQICFYMLMLCWCGILCLPSVVDKNQEWITTAGGRPACPPWVDGWIIMGYILPLMRTNRTYMCLAACVSAHSDSSQSKHQNTADSGRDN